MKKTTKIVLIVLSSVLIFAILVCASFAIYLKIEIDKINFSTDNLEEYYKVCEKDEAMPEVSIKEFEPCNDIDFFYEQDLWFFISERWYRLTMSYDESAYQKQVERIESEYTFISTIPDSDSYNKTFEYGDYVFRVCAPYNYPKVMSFIGFNEKSHKICYIYFSDFELYDTDDFPVFFEQHGFMEKQS